MAGREGMPARDRLIFALDVSTATEARELIDELQGTLRFFKVGLRLFVATGLEVVNDLVGKDLRLFLDLKMDDVTETIRSSVAEVAKLGVEFLTIHGNQATAEAAKEGKGNSTLKILSLTLLTSLNEQDLRDLFLVGPGRRFPALEDYIVWRADQALRHGCDGLIASGQNVKLLRGKFGPKPLIVCPGIRLQSDSSNDHKRPSTPGQAIANGADYLVVGRPIRNASDRVDKAHQIIDEIDSALGLAQE